MQWLHVFCPYLLWLPLRLYASQQRQLAPLPQAIYIGEANLTQPGELYGDACKLVRRVLIRRSRPQSAQKILVQLGGRRRHVVQIAKEPARFEQIVYFAIQSQLAGIGAALALGPRRAQA